MSAPARGSAPAVPEYAAVYVAPAGDADPAPSPDATAPASPLDLPRDTTPTYEPELLVSSIVLLALFQLPGVFAAVADRYGPHFSGVAGAAVSDVLRTVLTAATYALASCFVVHLILRGFWVALVGTDSMFPKGVRWDRMRESGPISREVVRERTRPLRYHIARLDNAATLVFTGGFLAAASIVTGLTGAVLVALLISALSAVRPSAPPWVALAVALALFVPFAVLPFVDLAFGARVRAGSRVHRVLHGGLRAASAIMPRSVGATASVLATNVDKRAFYGLFFLAIGAAYAGATASRDAGVPGAGAYHFFDGASQARGLVAGFYDDERGTGPRDPALPSIASEVVGGPYVRLFIPYVPRAHNDALPRTCPGLRAPRTDQQAGEDTAGIAAVLACAARVHRVALDGRPLAAVPLRFFVDPKAERRGWVAQIPVADLPAGEHALTVWPATRNGRPPAPAPWTITFWR